MRYRTVSEAESRTIVAVFDEGDEAQEGLKSIADNEHLSAASLTAVGAVREATLG